MIICGWVDSIRYLSIYCLFDFICRAVRIECIIKLNLLPFGSTIPYTLALIGAGAFFLAKEGVLGLATAVAPAIFIGAVVKRLKTLRTILKNEINMGYSILNSYRRT